MQIMRDKYDPTSAYLVLNNMRSKSNLYARNLYQWCRKQIKMQLECHLILQSGKSLSANMKICLHKVGLIYIHFC